MKHLALLATAAIGLFAATSLHAQDATSTTTTTTRTTRSKVAKTTSSTITARNNARLNARLRTTQSANITTTQNAPRLDGGVVRAVRSDNPLQAINPFAPAEYGSGEQVARHDPDDPFQRAQGLKLVEVEF